MIILQSSDAIEALAKEDFIATERRGDEVIFYYNNSEDLHQLADAMRKAGLEDADLTAGRSDSCARYNKRECDRAGGCCSWISSGGFNFCKCV